ncbi:YkgJ family cysteine cluster protein [Haliangium sp.]|uniref:YkgJ family cysteine cluster protein n=1 Tax=Haliangium sp. TaxID=2663208 RepID=UPI003D0A5240
MDPSRVYFTWPDGRFAYDCHGCGACCRGLGIGLDARAGQAERLLTLYPGLTPFLRARGATWTAFNPRGRCWFLDDDGLCRVEREHGRDTKPASCRLFPFNRVFRLGSWTIVDFNSVICPLRALPAPAADSPDPAGGDPGSGDDQISDIRASHADVLAEIATVHDPAVVGTRLPAEHAEQEGRRLVTRERAVAAACFAAADALADVSGAEREAEHWVARVWQAQRDSGGFDDARAGVSEALAALTGVPWQAPAPSTLASAAWVTPSLRFNELYGPRAYAPRPELARLLPDLWLAWLHHLALGAQAAGRTLDLRETTSVWAEVMPLCHLAARWRSAPTLDAGPVSLPDDADPDQVVRRFAEACVANLGTRKPLSTLLGPLLTDRPPSHRVVLARLIEPLLGTIRWRRAR